MNTIYSISLLILLQSSPKQDTIAFEQIAFNYYLSELAEKKLKGTLWIELRDFSKNKSWIPRCLEDFKIQNNDVVNSNASGLNEIELPISEKRLKIKPFGKGRFPRIYSTVSFSNKTNQHIVNIVEYQKGAGVIFHIEMNDDGEVINWCKGGWI